MGVPPGSYADPSQLQDAALVPPPDAVSITQIPPLAQQLAVSFNSVQTGLYTTPDDVILFTAWNSNTALTSIDLALRVLKPDGTLVMERMSLGRLTADRTANTVAMSQLDGFLVSAIVSGVNVPVSRGQCFVRAQMTRGGPLDVLVVDQLFADYVTTGNQPQWPEGELKSAVDGAGYVTAYTGTTPPIGNIPRLVQPANVRWRLISAFVTFTTGGAAANRIPQLQVRTNVPGIGDLVIAVAPAPIVFVASQGGNITWSAGITGFAPAVSVQQSSLAQDTVIAGGGDLTVLCPTITGTDQFSGILVLVEEWIDV